MSPSHNRATADRNLLFGILALQMNFVSRDALVAAMHAWVLDKTKPLGEILLRQGQVSAGQLEALDALIVQHLKMHGDDAERSLQALAAASRLPVLLGPVADDDVQASLANFSSATKLEATQSYAAVPADGTRYRILRPHAHGGLGDVFVALDTELHRRVALKEIKPQRADDPVSRGRFILEAEITGGLEHPGIVPVYGLGAHADGRPYYAMRFIRGNTLREASERFHAAEQPGREPGERSLALRQLLRRFIDVCNAMAYAHDRGVLHRDLKPSNIMLGKFGETLVVDWGLAKVGVGVGRSRDGGPRSQERDQEPESTGEERLLRPFSGSRIEPTQMGSAPGTPPFMSPEQAAGRIDELAPASDIYSLGSTLYLVLTGKKPYQATEEESILQQVARGQFPPPRQIKPDTPAALEAICCKAMAPRPQDRYATALALAADIEHWLADEPVAAYPEPWPARLGRWARRHRTTLVAAAVFLVSAVLALSATTALVWAEQKQTQTQKLLAEQNYELARAQSFNIIDLIASSEPHIADVPALHKTRHDILVLAARACRRYLEHQPHDPELRRRSAQVYRYTANVHRLVNEIESAEPLYQESVRLYEELAQEFPEQPIHQQSLADALRDHAKLQSNLGRLKQATQSLQRSIEIAERLRDQQAHRPTYRRTIAASLLSLALVEYTRGMLTESQKTGRRAADLYRALAELPAAEGHPYDPLLLAAAVDVIAISERESGQLDAARESHKEPAKLVTAMGDKRPTGVTDADVRHFLASFRLEQSRTWQAFPTARKATETNLSGTITVWEGLAKKFPWVPMYRESLGTAYQLRGQLRRHDERWEEAREDLHRSANLLESVANESPKVPDARAGLGRTYLELGRLARDGGDQAGASAWFDKAAKELAVARAQSPDNARDARSMKEVRAEQTKDSPFGFGSAPDRLRRSN